MHQLGVHLIDVFVGDCPAADLDQNVSDMGVILAKRVEPLPEPKNLASKPGEDADEEPVRVDTLLGLDT